MTLAEAVAAQTPLVQRLLDGVAAIGADPPGITRDAYGRGENEAQALIAAAGATLGLEARRDAGANLSLRWAGTDPDAPPILIGSHLDSVVQGGNFDGAAGVIAGIATVAALQAAGIRPADGYRGAGAALRGSGVVRPRPDRQPLPAGPAAARRARPAACPHRPDAGREHRRLRR